MSKNQDGRHIGANRALTAFDVCHLYSPDVKQPLGEASFVHLLLAFLKQNQPGTCHIGILEYFILDLKNKMAATIIH